MGDQKKQIILSKPEDWDTWISFVRIKATNQGVWNLVDPDFPVKPIALSIPIEPTFDLGVSAADFNQKAFEFYKAQHQVYKSRLARYIRQEEGFGAIISYIQETITAQNAILIQKTEAHPYSLLKALKERLAPSDSARALSLEKRYERLKKGPGGQNVETWVNEWQQMYIDASTHGLAEVSGDRPIRDFLLAIHSNDAAYATSQQNFQDLSPRTMDQIIENYRHHVRLHEATKHEVESHSAFPTNRKPSEDQPSGRVFSTSLKAQATRSLSIRNVLILDSGADTHVCNSSMKHRYTKQRTAHPDDRVESGAVMLPVESYGCLQVSLDTPAGPELVTLSNVAYVPTFHTNVAALDLFTAKGVHFDSAVPHMHTQGRTLFKIYRLGGHYTFTNTYSHAAVVPSYTLSSMPPPIPWHTKPAPVIASVSSLPVPRLSAPLVSPSFTERKKDVTQHSSPATVLPCASIASARVFSVASISSSDYRRTSFQDWLQIVSRPTSAALSSVRPASHKTASCISPQGQRRMRYKGKMGTRYEGSRSSRSAARLVKGVC